LSIIGLSLPSFSCDDVDGTSSLAQEVVLIRSERVVAGVAANLLHLKNILKWVVRKPIIKLSYPNVCVIVTKHGRMANVVSTY